MEEEQIILTAEQVRTIVQEELLKLNFLTQPDRTIFEKNLQILDARNIQLGRANGTMIGTASDQKLGFYGTSPVAKQNAISGPSGAGTAGVDASARTAITTIIATLKTIGITN